jgi:hypothetical protein
MRTLPIDSGLLAEQIVHDPIVPRPNKEAATRHSPSLLAVHFST